jgi:PAS domain S-box-containing protein
MFRFLLSSVQTPPVTIADELFESLPLGIVLQNTELRIVAVNRAAVRILRTPEQELLGRTTYDPRFRPQRSDGTPCPEDEHSAQVALRTGQPVTGFVLGVSGSDEQERWLRVTSVPVFTGSDRPRAVYSFFEDITETRRAERALAARVRQQQAVVDLQRMELAGASPHALSQRACDLCVDLLSATSAAVIVIGPDGNLRFDASVGWTPEDAASLVVPAAADASQAGYTLSVNDVVVAQDFDNETRFHIHSSVAVRARSGIAAPIAGATGPYGILGIHSQAAYHFGDDDVDFVRGIAGVLGTAVRHDAAEAEQRRLAEHLRQTQKLEAIGRLAGGIAHDFNNLMTIVLAYADALVSDGHATGAAADHISEIKVAAGRAALLTRQLLAFSRQQMLQPKTLEPNAIIENMDRMLRRIIGEDIVFETRLSSDAWNVKVDPGQLEQVLLNIVINARDAMPTGGAVRIETSNVEVKDDAAAEHRDVRPGEYVLITVCDTGCGMNAETLAHAFEPFFTTKGTAGTGLGLATVYGIVQQSGGEVWATSEPGAGTCVRVYLPRAIHPSDAPVVESPSRPTGAERVLIVEDERPVRELLARMLRRFGYAVVEAEDGAEALEVLQRAGGGFDLIVTDMVMPRMGGRALATEACRLWPGLRVLFISGHAGQDTLTSGGVGPGESFLQKPLTGAELAAKVREVLDARTGRT